MAQATSTVATQLKIPKQPECNIGTSGHVDHGKCVTWSTPVLLDGVPATGEEILQHVRLHGTLVTRVDGGEVYQFSNNSVISIDSSLRPSRANSLFYVQPYKGPMYTVRGRTGRTMSVTPEHPLLANRNGMVRWIQARDLREGDHVGFLSSVPLSETLTLPDPLPRLRAHYQIVTWDDYERLGLQTDEFRDFSGIRPDQFDALRIIACLSRTKLCQLAGMDPSTYAQTVREGWCRTLRSRQKLIAAFMSAKFDQLTPSQFLVEQKNHNSRFIRKISHIETVDSEIVKWFAFVW